MAEAVVNPPATAPGTVDKTSPEFQEALKQERERMRLDYDAEYRRKHQELEASYNGREPKPTPSGDNKDWFVSWGEKHGLPAEAGRELVSGVVDFFTNEKTGVLPSMIGPLSASSKRQELRSQRMELRQANPKLARFDEKYHQEALGYLEKVPPSLIQPDSYAKALHMAIGAHVEELEAEVGKKPDKEPEIAPGPEPMGTAGTGAKPKAPMLNAKQRQFCEEKGMSEADFVDMMQTRARNLEVKQGMSKNQVKVRLGELLGNLEF